MATSRTSPAEVYILDFDANRWAKLHTADLDDLLPLRKLNGEPRAGDWQPVRAHWETDGESRQPSDFSRLGGAPVFSARALDVLSDLLEGCGELLPIEVEDGGAYRVFNATRVIDALDPDCSEFEYFRSGRVLGIEKYCFIPERLTGETIFRLVQRPAVHEYVIDEFRRRAEENALTGFLWDRCVWRAT